MTGRKGRRALFLAVLVGLALAAPGIAAVEPDLEDRVREIAAELRCPVCDNLSVADSPADLAREMRGVIREQLEAGKTPDEVRAYFLAKYGDWVLLSPRARGLGWLVWVSPFAAAAVGLGVALAAVRRWVRRPDLRERPVLDPSLVERVRTEAAADSEGPSRADPEALSPLELERQRLYAALQELDFDHRSGKLSTADYMAMRQEYEFRAAEVLTALESGKEVAAAPAQAADDSRLAPPPPAASSEGRRHWRLAAGVVFVLVFGIALGHFLTASLRPRMGEQDTITGDFLTGTGPGGIAPWSSDSARHVPMLLASARTAYERGDFAAAIDGYKQVLAIDPQQPEALTSLGVILLYGGHVDEALVAIEQALAAAPGDSFALWAKGLALFEGKDDYAGAIRAWETLMAQALSEAEAARVSAMLAEARQRLAATGPPSSTAPSSTIRGTVTLGPDVERHDPAEGALFVIARRGDGPPIAVKRIPSPAFPVSFSLGPEDRMLGDADFDGELTLIARFKRDGAVGPAEPGDLEGRAPAPVRAGDSGIEIALSRIPVGLTGSLPETVDIHHVHGLAFDATDPEALLVATHTGLFRLERNRPPRRIGDHRFDLMGFTADHRGNGPLYSSGHPDVPTYAREGVGNLGLLVSRDGGGTWQSVALKGRADFHALTHSPHEGGRLYGWSVAGETGLHRIATGTWRVERPRGDGLRDVLALAASPTEPGVLLAGTERGARVSRDHGETWQPLRQLSPKAAVPAIAYDPDDGRVVYAYVHAAGEGLLQSRDGGGTWQPVGFVPRSGTMVVALAVGRSGHLALATTAAEIVRSRDRGRTWQTLVEGGRPR